MKYKQGYKYLLVGDEVISTAVHPDQRIETDYCSLEKNGTLTVFDRYAWDGPSGPAKWLSELPVIGWLYRRYLLPQILAGSLAHDCLFELMRDGYLDRYVYFKAANMTLRWVCVKKGTSSLRAGWIYLGVAWGGYGSATHERSILEAP